jgi:hypothetical protein
MRSFATRDPSKASSGASAGVGRPVWRSRPCTVELEVASATLGLMPSQPPARLFRSLIPETSVRG